MAAAGPVFGGWVVDFQDGDRMTVDQYWEDGDQAHLLRDGVDLTIPRARIQKVEAVSDPPPATVRHQAAAAAGSLPDRPRHEELTARQAAIDHHLLRVQRARFEAEARGDDPRRVNHLAKEFRRTQERRRDAAHALEQLDASH